MISLPRASLRLLLCVALFGAAALRAQDVPSRPPEKGSVPLHPPVRAREFRDLPYVTGGHERQKLDLYLPQGEGKHPLVVWVHGGGWQEGNKDGCPARALVPRGYAAASIGYRLSQHAVFPAQIEDCKAAIRWLRAHADEFGIDPERIGAWGASAGGHLVAMLGTTGHTREFDVGENLDQSSRVQCVIDWFGPADFLHWGEPPATAFNDDPKNAVSRLLGGMTSTHQEAARRASPVNFVRRDAAAFLIMHGDKDPLVPAQQSEELQAALQKAGVDSALKIIPGARHGGPEFNSPENRALMTNFLDRHLLKPGGN